MPYILLLGDIRQGVFYATLLSFWLVFAGEHMLIQETAGNSTLKSYWRHLSAVAIGCLSLFVFDVCERGAQLRNPFGSIWVSHVGSSILVSLAARRPWDESDSHLSFSFDCSSRSSAWRASRRASTSSSSATCCGACSATSASSAPRCRRCRSLAACTTRESSIVSNSSCWPHSSAPHSPSSGSSWIRRSRCSTGGRTPSISSSDRHSSPAFTACGTFTSSRCWSCTLPATSSGRKPTKTDKTAASMTAQQVYLGQSPSSTR